MINANQPGKMEPEMRNYTKATVGILKYESAPERISATLGYRDGDTDEVFDFYLKSRLCDDFEMVKFEAGADLGDVLIFMRQRGWTGEIRIETFSDGDLYEEPVLVESRVVRAPAVAVCTL